MPTPISLPGATREETQSFDDLRVYFSPIEMRTYNAKLKILSNDSITPEIEIDLLGVGDENQCPQAIVPEAEVTTSVGSIITLDGSNSTDRESPNGQPVEYDWVVVSRPEGSIAQPVESFNDPQNPEAGGPQDDCSTPNALFSPDVRGE